MPEGFVHMSVLVQLSIRQNSFTGTIPFTLGRVHECDLGHNQLEGAIQHHRTPAAAAQTRYFDRHLDISHNPLEGSLPP
eukprot:3426471-Amphidinium_carterae.1